MTLTASEPIHLGAMPGASLARAARAARQDARPRRRLWSRAALVDGLTLFALAWSVPVAVLAIGTPFALAAALLLWLVRLASSAL